MKCKFVLNQSMYNGSQASATHLVPVVVTPNRQLTSLAYIFILLFGMLLPALSHAQQQSDLYLGDVNFWHAKPISNLKKITDTPAYTNQPYFFSSNALYFTEMLTNDGVQQTDIFKLNLPKLDTHNFTQSPESEYSPTPLPKGKGMSVIRVNAQGKQELWRLDASGGAVEHLVPAIEPVGYQVWINEHELLLFVLGEPNTLQRVDTRLGKEKGVVIDTNIGASLYQFNRSVWFLYSHTQDANVLKAYNAKTNKTMVVGNLPDAASYFSVSATGDIITSNGESLFHQKLFQKGGKLQVQSSWRKIDVPEVACKSGVSRTAISHFGDKIVLVCPRVAP
ncbi:hypothetical protein ACFO4O_14145 [Glaciecola siphonariae]|uniref:Uncharacterized protein n=1 Tax=Glaciecola siphonariae TaxID=521012 RepID=A0ABV9LXM0_9ALTE